MDWRLAAVLRGRAAWWLQRRRARARPAEIQPRMIRTLAFAIVITFCAGTAGAETIDIGGVARSYFTQFPETRPAPLVIVLHGNSQSGADMRTRTSWSLGASRERFGVIYPDGLTRAWADLRPDSKRA